MGDLPLRMKADMQFLVQDVLHNKREAGIMKARQRSIWLQIRRQSSVPSPGDLLCFVVLIGAGASITLQPIWEDAMCFSGERDWKASGCREMLVLCNSWRLFGRSQVSISAYSIPSNLHCGNASRAACFFTAFSLKSGFSLASGPL